jgi:hypothetical protein
MDRDKIFVELMKGLLANPNIVKDRYALNYDSARNQVIEMAKEMTNRVMQEITDEDEKNEDLE